MGGYGDKDRGIVNECQRLFSFKFKLVLLYNDGNTRFIKESSHWPR